MEEKKLIIKGAREHNLKNINIEIPRDRLVVITGLSGSGKSSLAFDTIYAEGQRRYVRVLFARAGRPYCYKCGKEITAQTVSQMVDAIMAFSEGTKLQILAPIIRGRKGEYKKELNQLKKEGFVRVRIDGKIYELSEAENIKIDKNKKHTIEVVVDRIIIKPAIERRLADSIETALKMAEGIAIASTDNGDTLFSEKLACIDCGVSYPEIAPRIFSFNSPYGACPECAGIGSLIEIDEDLVVPNKNLSIREGAIRPWERRSSVYYYQMLESLSKHYGFDLRTPFKDLSPQHQKIILYGSADEEIKFSYDNDGKREYYYKVFEGVIENLKRRYKETDSSYIREEIERYMSMHPCPVCKGARLKPESLAIKINEKSIIDATRLSIKEALRFFSSLSLTEKEAIIAQRILKEIRERLGFLVNVGLDYLTLDRTASTLSGGEGQRIRLATQIGSSLVGVLYILDEPSVGLHQRDNVRLLNTLKKMRDLGNSVLVVEHDEETIRNADYVIDMGPGAGAEGGEIIAEGKPDEIMENENSLTGRYLSGRLVIPVPAQRRKANGFITIAGARENNLKNIDVKIPLSILTCITGVSGSGKSTLILEILYKNLAQRLYNSREKAGLCKEIKGLSAIDKVINIDQSPIGRTPRSNPATYTGLFTFIRDLFSQLPESRMRGYKPGRYSFNVKGGRCEACQGDGLIKIEMHFLPDVYVTCEVCKGKRYNRETLDIRYKGKNISDILDMTVSEAMEFFENIPHIKTKLETLNDVGLGYIKLGQSATTLSGGEAQRVKLSKELSKRATGRTLYILDEPTTGLHFADIHKLLEVLNRLADMGNTVVVIEHNMDVLKTADHIIDLGPEGGDNGGEIIAEGTPEAIIEMEHSYTGQYLKKILRPHESILMAS
ncbi:MAG: excinuclease ABC subunit UvrA [Nitrospirae bacterium]|nr:excinuclease ABC subunit UvrA [Nitrospirota bacterium]